MYNVEQMIAEGQAAIKRHPRRGASVADIMALTSDNYDRWERTDRLYLFGIALGMRIAKAEQRKGRTLTEARRKPGKGTVQARIAEYVKDSGMEPAAISDRSGIGLHRLQEIIKGNREMTAAEYEQICRAIGKTPDDFMIMTNGRETGSD